MTATAGPLQELQTSTSTAVPKSESMESVGESASGASTPATAPTMASPVQGPTISSASDPLQYLVAVPTNPSQSSLSQKGIHINANEPTQDSIRPKFAPSPGYGVPALSFSYGVMPRISSPHGNPQQSSPSPGLKLTPPIPAASLQPPVPGQFLGNRPFSYNVVSHANVVQASGQQIQLNTASVRGQFQGGKFAPPSAASLQPPVPRQPVRPTPFGVISSILPAHMQFPLSVSKGDATKQTNFSFSGNNQLTRIDKSETIMFSEKGSTEAGTAEGSSGPTTLVNSHSVQTSHSMPLGTSMALGTNAYASSTSMLIPAAPSFTAHAELPSIDKKPGLPGVSNSSTISNTATLRLTPTNSSISPVVPVPSTLPPTSASAPVPFVPQNVQQQINPHYSSQPAMALSHQAFWSHPPQAGQMQHAPFSPYPGFYPGPFPLPVQGIPPVPLLFVQTPGVPPVLSQAEPTTTATGSLQTGSNTAADLPSSDIDQDKKLSNLDKNGGDANEIENAWTEHKTETGVSYYYNSITGKSAYEKPSNFKQEKITVQSAPVSCLKHQRAELASLGSDALLGEPSLCFSHGLLREKLDSTDWTLVTTNDGKKYYYDSKNKVSSWQVPAEVAYLKKSQETNSMEGSVAQVQELSTQGDKVPALSSINTPTAQTGGRDSVALRSSAAPVSSSALDIVKKKLQEAGSPMVASPHPASAPVMSDANGSNAVETVVKGQKDKAKDATGEGTTMSDSSSDSDDESGPSKEECIIQFKDMLKERGVAPFSKWEKELPKIVFDPRFKAVPSHSARRTLFEHYVRTRAEEERKEKRAAQKAAIDSFKQLLEEASEDIDHKTDYQSFKRKWGSDPRFEAIDRKERELLLNQKVKVAEDKIRAVHMAAATSFNAMLRDHKDITVSSRWSRVKDSLRDDPRYKAVKHEERETLFNEYIAELKAAEDEAERSAKAKRDEQEKLKERERELRKRKEREEQEMERVKIKVRRKEAEYTYRALLVEKIKDRKASWTESKPKLEKDPQGRATNPDLAKEDAERLFREHVKDLYERCANDFRLLLAEVVTADDAATEDDGKTVLNSWTEAKRVLRPDPRYSKMPSKDRESLWRRYAEDLLRKQNSASNPKEKSETDTRNKTPSADRSKKSPPRRSSHGRR